MARSVEFFQEMVTNIREGEIAHNERGPRPLRRAGHAGAITHSSHREKRESQPPATRAAWSEFHVQINVLPDKEREMFDLLWYQGLKQAEVAELLGVSERTVKKRWQAARLQLRAALQGESPGS